MNSNLKKDWQLCTTWGKIRFISVMLLLITIGSIGIYNALLFANSNPKNYFYLIFAILAIISLSLSFFIRLSPKDNRKQVKSKKK